MTDETRTTGEARTQHTVLIAFRLPTSCVDLVRTSLPDWTVRYETDPQRIIQAIPDADVVFTISLSPEALQAARQVRWIHAGATGVNGWDMAALRARGITLTNSRGAHGGPMAELVIALMLSFSTGLNRLIAAQRDFGGPPELIREVRGSTFELAGQTIGVVGLGTIGMSVAEDAHGLGMRVLGVRRRLPSDAAPGQPAPPYLDAVYGPEGLATVLAEADHVALCLPLTPDTDGLMGETQLRQMRRTAYLYNVGRGATIDQPVLERALAEGWIAGAGLDVTIPEPLPASSPLWTMPNVILSQHSGGHTEEAWLRVTRVFLHNVRAYEQGAPFPTLVDLDAGY